MIFFPPLKSSKRYIFHRETNIIFALYLYSIIRSIIAVKRQDGGESCNEGFEAEETDERRFKVEVFWPCGQSS